MIARGVGDLDGGVLAELITQDGARVGADPLALEAITRARVVQSLAGVARGDRVLDLELIEREVRTVLGADGEEGDVVVRKGAERSG